MKENKKEQPECNGCVHWSSNEICMNCNSNNVGRKMRGCSGCSECENKMRKLFE